MTKTTNYQLPKWEKTDRIQMKDFNDMTAALDAALAGKGEFQKLFDASPAEQSAPYILDLSGIDWGKWQYVHIDVVIRGSGAFCVYPTGQEFNSMCDGWNLNGTHRSIAGQLGDSAIYDCRITVCTSRMAGRYFRCVTDGLAGQCSVPLSAVKSLTFEPMGSGYLSPESKFTVWGQN